MKNKKRFAKSLLVLLVCISFIKPALSATNITPDAYATVPSVCSDSPHAPTQG